MKKSLTLCIAVLLTLFCGKTMGQTDITSKYLSNPSFEADAASATSSNAVNNSADGLRGYNLSSPSAWTVSGADITKLLVNKDCYTDNNFGKVTTLADGTYAYYLRMGWSTGTTTMTQSVKLPAGKYRFSIDHRSGYANGASSSMKMTAEKEYSTVTFTQGSAGIFTSLTWSTNYVDFELSSEKSVALTLTFDWKSGGSCIMLDNAKLYDMSTYVEPQDPTEDEVSSPTEGIIDNTFVPEANMKSDLLKMLAKFSTYLVNDYQACAAPNSKGEECGCFKGESTMAANEAGVRTNADLSMICAFLVKYGKPAGVTLPAGVTYDILADYARKTLVFAYSTHKANKLKVCSGNAYWGSTSNADHVWESSLWAMSVAYSAFFQWNTLSTEQKGYIYNMLKAECNYELERSIPTGYAGDTKAEENGWEADVLAVTLGLFPNDELAPKWFERLREFAVNSYSHYSDASNNNVIDPWYNTQTVADLFKGNNLYNDYSLQNHNLFHTSYQNVVMQELGEAALALKMFQTELYGTEKWKTNALMHNNQQVMDNIMNWLALADGELAMPNGNDWSLFLYDQITSYTTQACFQRDANALTLENLAYKQIKARQTTTTDGSWLLRPDVQARRMGVEAHRVMMTYLMHDVLSTADLTPTSWDDFRNNHSQARMLPDQNIVRAYTKDRFTCFSWSNGLKSYTGYFAPDSPDKNKIIVPYRANSTGNIIGWYEVSGKATDATPVVNGIYQMKGNGYVMNGELNTNASSLNNRFAIYSTPGNAFIYLDYVTALTNATITAEKGGLLAISTDELTKLKRTLYFQKGEEITHKQLDGTSLSQYNSEWVNIDNQLGVVGKNGKSIAFGDRGANNSIYTSKLYPMYNGTSRQVTTNALVDARNLVYYSNIDAETTAKMYSQLQRPIVPAGWNAVIAADPDGVSYLLAGNFKSSTTKATLTDITCVLGAPVFDTETSIANGKSSVTLNAKQNNSIGNTLKIFIKEGNVTAMQADDDETAYVTSDAEQTISMFIIANGETISGDVTIHAGETLKISVKDGKLVSEETKVPDTNTPGSNQSGCIVNPGFDEGTNGWSGSPTVNFSTAEKYNTTFNVYQKITGLVPGIYELEVQGFYRNGDYNPAASLRNSGKEDLCALLYATSSIESVSTPLKSIFEEAGKLGTVGAKANIYGYIPNTMDQASFYFQQGLYENNIRVKVGTNGELTIGVKKTTAKTNDWCIFDNFRLTLVAPLKSATLKKSSGKWGTFIAPFELNVPEDLTINAVNGIEDDVLQLSPLSEVVPAYTPVVIKFEGDDKPVEGYVFEEKKSASDNYLTGVLESTSVPAGNFVLTTKDDLTAFYKVTDSFSIEAGQCYLTLPAGSEANVIYLESNPTAIKGIMTQSGKTSYDLMGRKLDGDEKTATPIIIKEGKKFLKN